MSALARSGPLWPCENCTSSRRARRVARAPARRVRLAPAGAPATAAPTPGSWRERHGAVGPLLTYGSYQGFTARVSMLALQDCPGKGRTRQSRL